MATLFRQAMHSTPAYAGVSLWHEPARERRSGMCRPESGWGPPYAPPDAAFPADATDTPVQR
jgi:hypothetical protein